MFKKALQNILDRTEGSLGVMIMGLDGIAVDKAWNEDESDSNLDIAVAEYTSLVRRAKQSSNDSGIGGLREITVSNNDAIFILRLLGEEYFLALIMSSGGNFGRGRYELRRAELRMEHEFAL
jgi:predicted regulator of Ras-like GTPase activity (Roadblock/LC7/MglB family)